MTTRTGLTLPTQVECYVRDVVLLTRRLFGPDKLVSVLLFGSHAKEQACSISDCDTVVVLDSSVRRRQIRASQPYFHALEVKYGFRKPAGSLIGGILRAVEATTGMFMSHFVCKLRDVERLDFARMFNLNYLFAKVLAPSKFVIGSIAHSARTYHGRDLLPLLLRVRAGPFQVLKNLLVTTLISLSSSLIMILTPNAIKYHLEAVKWAMNGCYFYLRGKSPPLKRIGRFFGELGVSRRFLAKFYHYRDAPRVDPVFSLATFPQVIRIHALALALKSRHGIALRGAPRAP